MAAGGIVSGVFSGAIDWLGAAPKNSYELPGSGPGAARWKPPQPNSPDQDALIQLAKDAKNRGGVKPGDVEVLKKWCGEYDGPVRGPEVHPNRPFGQHPHIHVGPVDHIPVN